ncbi:uncharacterized protein LOC118800953 [Colossoma macropomum]|uniref:uncharacterized protein LOC118800953 n=1 Tax=Colossoma macropomum TaxID=42526 RepID=UPI0018641A0E|nr:uncharacterized protein LOC118800953 [Colossoma macropomum]
MIHTPDHSEEPAITNQTLPTATLTVEPKRSPVFTGESVTLKCEIESHSNWSYQWYKGNSSTAVNQSQTNTFTIRSAADQDPYWCRGERDNRPSSSQLSNPVTLTVKGSGSGVIVGLSVGLIIIVVLGLFWCYKKKKGNQQNTNQTPDQSQNPGSTLMQTDSGPEPGDMTYVQIDLKEKKKPKKIRDKLLEDDSAADSSDVTYAQVIIKKKKFRGKATTSDEVTYSQIAMKSLKQDSKGSGPEPGDLTYAQIDLKEKKKPKKPKKTQNKLLEGKSSDGADTVYSELKH